MSRAIRTYQKQRLWASLNWQEPLNAFRKIFCHRWELVRNKYFKRHLIAVTVKVGSIGYLHSGFPHSTYGGFPPSSAPNLVLPAVLRFREIHLKPASVDYQLVSCKLGCRWAQFDATWARNVPYRCLKWWFGLQVNFTNTKMTASQQCSQKRPGTHPWLFITRCFQPSTSYKPVSTPPR